MKSIKRVLLLIICCSFLISCDVKRSSLVCSIDKSTKEGITEKMSTTVEYANKKVDKVNFVYLLNYDLDMYKEDEIVSLTNSIKEEYEKTYGDNKNISISSSRNGNKEFSISVAVNYSKLTTEEREKYGLSFPDGIEKSKSDFEADGYTCEIG